MKKKQQQQVARSEALQAGSIVCCMFNIIPSPTPRSRNYNSANDINAAATSAYQFPVPHLTFPFPA